MEYPFAHSTYVDTHHSGIQRSRDWWSDSASGAGEIGNEDRSWSDGRPLQSNEPADVIPAQISVLTVSHYRAPEEVAAQQLGLSGTGVLQLAFQSVSPLPRRPPLAR